MGKQNLRTECSGLEWGDFLLLLDKLKKEKEYRFLLFTAISTYGGLRANDTLNLRWIDVLNKTEIEIKETKTSKVRHITMNQNLIDIINYCYEQLAVKLGDDFQEEQYIFCNRKKGRLSIQYINRKLHEIFRYNNSKIKVQNPSTHTFRKTFGKRIYEMNGRSPEALVLLSQIFGHSSIAITRKYIGISQEQIQNVYISL
jgi:integrase